MCHSPSYRRIALAIAGALAFPAGVKTLRSPGLNCWIERWRHIPDTASPVPSVPANGPPVFISGCNRGGTSILSQLLAYHPELNSVGRGRYHEGIWLWDKRFHDKSQHRWAVEPWLCSMRKTAADATPDMMEFFRDAYASVCVGGRMLEKTPANAVRLRFIDRLYPDCYILHVLRDGRHTTASLRARHVQMPYAAQQWVGVHTTALPDLDHIGPERTLVVRYEELLSSPMETLLELCRHCGLDTGRAAQDALAGAVSRRLKQPRNRWRAMARSERRCTLEIIGDLQARLGYPVEE